MAVSIALVSDYRGNDEGANYVDCEGDEGRDEDDLWLVSSRTSTWLQKLTLKTSKNPMLNNEWICGLGRSEVGTLRSQGGLRGGLTMRSGALMLRLPAKVEKRMCISNKYYKRCVYFENGCEV